MTKAIERIALSPSCDIPFNKLVLSQSTGRSVNASILIERLAENVAHMFVFTDAAGVGVSAKVLNRFRIVGISEREVA